MGKMEPHQDKLTGHLHQEPGHILIVDDEVSIGVALERVLGAAGHRVTRVMTGQQGLEAFERCGPFELVMLDIRLPGPDGMALLERFKTLDPHLSVLMMTGFASVDTAIKALKLGALDYLTKPFDDIFKLADEAVTHAIAQTRLARATANQCKAVTLELERAGGIFEGMVGRSQSMQRVYEMIVEVAPTDVTVLIQGDTGTGKELVATAIHSRSSRSRGPFVPINCAALPAELIESELFGHEKGVFTSAHQARPGLFEVAHGGTLFLDEVAELPLELQAKLLRVLEHGEVRRLGASRPRFVDVRVIAATHKPLRELIHQRLFRSDLFYRLAVVTLAVPALRHRPGDIPLLANHFLHAHQRRGDKIALEGFDNSALEVLCRHDWPGNVRELRNVLERAFIFAQGPLIHAMDMPEDVNASPQAWFETRPEELTTLHFKQAKQQAIEAFEQRYLTEVLRRNDGNITRAAHQAGMDRSNFRRLMKKISH